jgi:hypothetical protein
MSCEKSVPARGPVWVKMRRTRIEHMLSPYHPIATGERTSRIGSFVPGTDICSAANYSLFDHLVGAEQDRSRYVETQRLRGLEIDD